MAAPEQSIEYARPPASSDDVRVRQEHQALRHRMLRGLWREDAERRLQQWFDKSTWQFLPRAVIAFNVAKSLWTQTATLYDGAVTVHVDGKAVDAAQSAVLGLMLLWVQQQETLEYVRAQNDAMVLRSWDNERKRVRYEPVSVECVDAYASATDPSQPACVVRDQRRDVPGIGNVWVRETWDASGMLAILAFRRVDGQDEWEDVTLRCMPEVANLPGHWPFWTNPPPDPAEVPEGHDFGEPIWPWTAYHHKVSRRMFDPFYGCEVVDGTLDVAVDWTFWMGGLRDASFNQRWMLDAEVPSHGSGQPFVAANPMAVMRLVSSGGEGKSAAVGAWPAPLDVEKAANAIGNVAASMGLHVGLSGSDTTAPTSGLSRVSGLAIEVSNEGKRKIERRVEAPMAAGDRHNLAGAAALANAYGGASLPTNPDAYAVVYSSTPRTAAETKAEVDEIVTLEEAGLLHRAQALMRLEPGLTMEQAKDKAREIADFNRGLGEAVETAGDPDQDAKPTEPEPAAAEGVEKVADTAMNGAQVTSAQGIVQAVVDELLPMESAAAMLAVFFRLTDAEARAILDPIANFKPKPKPAPMPFGGPPAAPPKPDDEPDETEEGDDAGA